MFNLFMMGGPLFMGILTLLFLVILCIAVASAIKMSKFDNLAVEKQRHQHSYIKSVGLFSLVFGILGQLIGLYSAFQHIEVVGEISTTMLAGGLKISSICTLYGLVIFLIAYLLWFGLDIWLNRYETIEAS